MRILVTGAAGFIGSHLCDRLLLGGHDVRGIDNLQTGRMNNLPLDATNTGTGWFWKGDVTAPDFTRWAADIKPDVIVHAAASYDDRDKWHRDTQTNVQGGINVAIAARESGARVVYFQTALIYGNKPRDWDGFYERWKPANETLSIGTPDDPGTHINPENSYAISKYAAGQYLRHADIPLLELRLANIYGPRNLSGPVPTFYKRLSEGQPCTVTDSRRDFVYIQDLVELVDQAIAEQATGTYHVSTGTDYPIKDVYQFVADALDIPEVFGGPEITPRGPDDAPTILLDPSETQRDFTWRATTDLDEGIESAVAWYQEHGVTETYTHLAVKG